MIRLPLIAAALLLTACGEPTEDINCTDYRAQMVWQFRADGDWNGPVSQRVCVISETKIEAPK